MIFKCSTILLMLIVWIQPLKTSPLENEKLRELTERFDQMQTKMKAEIEKLTARIDVMQSENGNLKSNVKELKTRFADQDHHIVLLKKQISHLIESLQSTRSAHISSNTVGNGTFTHSELSTRSLSNPPSSCQELKNGQSIADLADGIHLLKIGNKIQAAFCTFNYSSNTVVQELVGTVDVKTKNVHFYVQKKTKFGPGGGVIPFDEAPLNEGNAFDLTSGIFTAPVPGIYHFDFSAVKDPTSNYLDIYLFKNDASVGATSAYQTAAGSFDVVSLSSSLRLVADDIVYLNNVNTGVLLDDSNHLTHFTGWLVDEDLM